MANSNIKIGVEVVVKEVQGINKVAENLRKVVDQVDKALKSVDFDGDIKFDKSSLESFRKLIGMFNQVIDRLSKTLAANSNVKLKLQDDGKQIENVLVGAFQEALDKMEKRMKELGQQFEQDATQAGKKFSKASKSGGGAGGGKGSPDLDADGVRKNADGMEGFSTKGIERGSLAHLQKIQKQLEEVGDVGVTELRKVNAAIKKTEAELEEVEMEMRSNKSAFNEARQWTKTWDNLSSSVSKTEKQLTKVNKEIKSNSLDHIQKELKQAKEGYEEMRKAAIKNPTVEKDSELKKQRIAVEHLAKEEKRVKNQSDKVVKSLERRRQELKKILALEKRAMQQVAPGGTFKGAQSEIGKKRNVVKKNPGTYKDLEKVKQDLEGDLKSSPEKKQQQELRKTAELTELLAKRIELRTENTERQISVDKRARGLLQELGDTSAKAGRELAKAMKNQDLHSMEAFGKSIERTGTRVASGINEIRDQVRALKNESKQLKNSRDQLEAQAQNIKPNREGMKRIAAIKTEIKAIDKRRKEVEKSIKVNKKDEHSLERSLATLNKQKQQYRANRDVLKTYYNELQKGRRDYQKLHLSIDTNEEALEALQKRTREGIFDKATLLESRDLIKRFQSDLKKTQSTIARLQKEKIIGKRAIEAEAASGGGNFAGLDESGKEARKLEMIESLYKSIDQQIQHTRREAKGLENTLSKGGAVNALEKKANAFDEMAKASDKLKKVENKTKELIARQKILGEATIDTAGAYKRAARSAKDIDKDYKRLSNSIEELEQEFIRMGGSSTEAGRKAEVALKRVRNARKQLVGGLGGQASMKRGSIRAMGKDFEKAESDITKFSNQITRMRREMNMADKAIDQGGNAALVGAQKMKKLGGNAKDMRDKTAYVVHTFRQMKREGKDLTKVESKLLRQALRLNKAFSKMGARVDKSRYALDKVEKSAKRAGKGFRLYRMELADSVRNNFKFINSMSLIMAGLMGLSMGFMEILEESRAYARVMTVARSASKDFEEMLTEVKTRVRETAIEFGEATEEVAEVVKQFGSAGLTIEESMAGLDAAMRLITTTSADAEATTRSMAGMYNVFGDSMDNATSKLQKMNRISDVLTSVYRNHQAELDEMTQGLKFVAATGKVAGFQFEELSAFLAVLNDNMIKSGQAGRTLQRVFAQFAAKTGQFKEALDVEVDPNMSLDKQFLAVLEEVNKKLRSGETTLRDLNASFSLFGLRGAKAFEVLAGNVDDVKSTITELRDDSAGLSRNLSENVKETLARKFESAKQVLLEFMRNGLDPAKEALISITHALQQFQEAMDMLGLDKLISNFVVWGGAAIVLTQGIGALIMVFGTLFTSMKNAVSSVITSTAALFTHERSVNANIDSLLVSAAVTESHAKAHLSEAQAARIAAASESELASARAAASRTGGAAVASKGLSAGAVGLIAVAMIGLVAAIGYMVDSIEDMQESFDETAASIAKMTTKTNELEKFRKDLGSINDEVRLFSTETSVAADKVRDLFKNSGAELSMENEVLTMSDEDLVNELPRIYEQVRVEVGKRVNNINSDVLESNDKLISLSAQMLDRQFGKQRSAFKAQEGVIGSVFFTLSEAANSFAADWADIWDDRPVEDVQDKIEELKMTLYLIKEVGDLRITASGNIVSDRANRDWKAHGEQIQKLLNDGLLDDLARGMEEEYSARLNGLLNNVGGKTADEVVRARKKLEDALYFNVEEMATVEGVDGLLFNVKEVHENILRIAETMEGVNFNVMKTLEVDPVRETSALLNKLFDIMDAPVPMKNFMRIRHELNELKEDIKDTEKVLGDFITMDSADIHSEATMLMDVPALQKTMGDQAKALGTNTQRAILRGIREANVKTPILKEAMKPFQDSRSAVEDMSDEAVASELVEVTQGVSANLIDSSDNAADIADDMGRMAKNSGLFNVNMQGLGEFTEIFSEAASKAGQGVSDTADQVKDLRNAIQNDQITTMLDQRRNDIFREYIDLMDDAAKRQKTLNSLAKQYMKWEELRQEQLLRGDIGLGNEDLQKKIDDLNFDFSPDSTDFAMEEFDKSLEAGFELLEIRRKNAELSADEYEVAKNIFLQIQAGINAIQEKNTQIGITNRNLKGNLSLVTEEARQLDETVDARLEELKATEKLIAKQDDLNEVVKNGPHGDMRASEYLLSIEGLQEIKGLQNDLIALRYKALSAVREENEMLFENLELTEKILNPQVKHAGVQYKVLGWARKINHIEKMRVLRQEQLTAKSEEHRISMAQYQSEMIRLDNQTLKVWEEFNKLAEETKETEKEINEHVDNRIDLYEKLSEHLGGQADELADVINDALTDSLDFDRMGVIGQMSESLGRDIVSTMGDAEGAVNDFVAGVRSGRVNLGQLDGAMATVANRAREYRREQEKVNDRLRELRQFKLDRSQGQFSRYLDADEVKEAEKALDTYVGTAQKLYKDSPTALTGSLEWATKAAERLAELQVSTSKKKYKMVFDDEGLQAIKMLLDVIDDKVKEIGDRQLSFLPDGITDPKKFAQEIRKNLEGEGMDIFRNAEGRASVRNDHLSNIDSNIQRIANEVTSRDGRAMAGMTEASKASKEVSGTGESAKALEKNLDDMGATSEKANKAMKEVEKTTKSLSDVAKTTKPQDVDRELTDKVRGIEADAAKAVIGWQMGVAAMEAGRGKALQDRGSDVIDNSFVWQSLQEGMEMFTKNAGETLSSFFDSVFVPEFAKANAEVYEQYIEQLENIRVQYKRNVSTAIDGLQRNESTYYSYLNSIMDAEKQRQQSILDAQKQYRESLKKTKDVIKEQFGEAFKQVFNAKAVSSIVGQFTQGLFGAPDLETSLNQFAGALNVASDRLIEAGTDFLKGKLTEMGMDLSESASRTFDELRPELKKNLTDMFSDDVEGDIGLKMAKEQMTKGFLDSLPDEAFIQNEFALRTYEILDSATSVFGSAFAAAASSMAGMLTTGISRIVEMTLSGDADRMRVFYLKFIEELPRAIEEFTNEFSENFETMIEAISDNLPEIVDSFIEAFPEVISGIITALEDSLPKIVETLAGALPRIVEQVFPLIIDFFLLIIEQVPTILGSIAGVIPTLIAQLLAKLPEIIIVVIKAVFESIIDIIVGLFSNGPAGGIVTIALAMAGMMYAWEGATESAISSEATKAELLNFQRVNLQMERDNAIEMRSTLEQIQAQQTGQVASSAKNASQTIDEAKKGTRRAAQGAEQGARASEGAMQAAVSAVGIAMAGINLIQAMESDAPTGEKVGSVIGTIVGGVGGALVGGLQGGSIGAGLGGMLGRGIGGIFHEGGMIGGNEEEQLILAQKGEGVLSRSGMRALGGRGALDALNSGKLDFAKLQELQGVPVYHDGGVVGDKSATSSYDPKSVTRSGGTNNEYVDNSTYTVNMKVEGGSSGNRREDKKYAREMATEIDKQLAKMKEDRKSRLAKSMKDD